MRFLAGSIGWVGLMVCAGALAQTSPVESTLQVSVGVPASCSMSTQGGIHLPQYNPVEKGASGSTTSIPFTVRCNRQSTPVYVSLDQGQSPAAGSSCASPLRTMVSEAGKTLPYRLYWGPTETVVWGCEGSNRLPVGFEQTIENRLDIWTVIASGSDASVGDYADTVTVSIEF